jgi:hypothetical protein
VNELDEILLDQLHVARRGKKRMKRMMKAMPHEPLLQVGVEMTEKRIEFYESMIMDKELLKKKHKKKKQKDPDILARSPVYEWYRVAFIATTLGYKMLMDSAATYMSYFKKGKQE